MAYNRTFALDISWKSPHRRTRYAVGKYAGMLIRMRVWLGDRLFDRVILGHML